MLCLCILFIYSELLYEYLYFCIFLFQGSILVLDLSFVILDGSLNHFLQVHDLAPHILLDDLALLQLALQVVLFLELAIEEGTDLPHPVSNHIIRLLTEMLESTRNAYIILLELSQLPLHLVQNVGVILKRNCLLLDHA